VKEEPVAERGAGGDERGERRDADGDPGLAEQSFIPAARPACSGGAELRGRGIENYGP
jgi:hypothetical protein